MGFTFSSIPMLTAGGAIALVAIIAAFRSGLPGLARLLFSIAAALLAISAGSPTVRWERTPNVAVLVDLSASTRSAAYRDPRILEARIKQLLPEVTARTYFFSNTMSPAPTGALAGGARLADLPGDRTTYAAPPADAIVLFSDGQFPLPTASPPVYAVIDESTLTAADAAVRRLEFRDSSAVATVSNSGDVRELTIEGAGGAAITAVAGRSMVINRPIDANVRSIAASFNTADLWPENDSLAALRPMQRSEWWWIGGSPPDGWIAPVAGSLSADLGDYLGAGVIVIDCRADELSQAAQNALAKYARELGGTLILRGGERGFAAGGWTATPFDDVSPLAASPPEPARLWMLLIDASGSMAADADGQSRFERATAAMRDLAGTLPPNDRALVGSVAERLTPWAGPVSAADIAGKISPPPNLTPRGPTNIETILKELTGTKESLRREIILVTDGEAVIADPEQLGTSLRAANGTLRLLTIGDASRAGALERAAVASGGSRISEAATGDWSKALAELARGGIGDRLVRQRFRVSFPPTVDHSVSGETFNETWPREGAEVMAEVDSAGRWPLAANWRMGAGRVVSFAFEVDPVVIDKAAAAFAAPPRDPRVTIEVIGADREIVRVDARDTGEQGKSIPINGLRGNIRPIETSAAVVELRQVSPGRYEAEMERAAQPRILAVTLDDEVIDRIVVPARSPIEFDAIGLNRANLAELAERTGGAVIETEDDRAISLPRVTRRRDLAALCAGAAAILVLAGLVAVRRAV